MIYYIATGEHLYPIGMYLDHWGRPLRSRITLLSYAELFEARVFSAGVYVFTDFDRLTPADCTKAAAICDFLADSGMRVLNHPAHSMRRYDVLQMLAADGSNRFRAFRPSEIPEDLRYPVILRVENDHDRLTGPLHSSVDLRDAIETFQSEGFSAHELVVTEFCDTSGTSGIFVKSNMFVIGDRLVPRGFYCNREWLVRFTEVVTPEIIAAEREFALSDTYEAFFRPIFKRARITYGRADFSLLDGTPQIWEINTNPIIVEPPHRFPPELIPNQRIYGERFFGAFRELDAEAPTGFTVEAPETWSEHPTLSGTAGT